jgi:hypothetical protein
MTIKEQSQDGTIYQVEMDFEGIGVAVVDIAYSGYTDASENDVLEFAYAIAEEQSNSDLYTEEQLNEINKILECGREETIVRFLMDHYEKCNVRFDVGEYDWIIKNT